MKPPTRYYGSKWNLSAKIVPLLPPHTNYVEPFMGSASVFFRKGRPELSSARDYREVLNDTNTDLVNLFRVIRDPQRLQTLSRELEHTPYARAEYQWALEVLGSSGPESECDTQRAWATFVVLEMSVGAQLGNSGWSKALSGPNSRLHTQTWAEKTRPERLHAIGDRLRQAYIECLNAEACIRAWDSPDTCFYVDPPYPGADQGHYRGFTQGDFERLIDLLSSCSGSVVLSGYDNPAVPSEWQRHEFDVLTSANTRTSKSRARTEVVWVRPSVKPQRRSAARAVGVQTDLDLA